MGGKVQVTSTWLKAHLTQLGGKSPVIIAPDANVKIAAKRMMSVKQMGIGQVCLPSCSHACPSSSAITAAYYVDVRSVQSIWKPNPSAQD